MLERAGIRSALSNLNMEIKMGLFDDLDIGNEKLPGKKPVTTSKDQVEGFIKSADRQIGLVDHILKHKEWPKTEGGREEKSWFAETEKGVSDVCVVRVLQGVSSPLDLKMKKETLDREHVAAIHTKLLEQFNEDLKAGKFEDRIKAGKTIQELTPTLLDAYNTVAEPTIKGLKGLKAVKSVLERLKTAAIKELRPFINEAAFYSPKRGRKAK